MMPAVKFGLQITASILLLAIIFAADTFGQSQRNRPDPARHAEDNERDLEQRIWNLRLLAEEASKPRPKKPTPEQALEQLQKDFTQLQILNKSLLRAALGNMPLDARFVSKSVTEIRERAQRLNTNLALPQPEPAARSAIEPLAGPEQLKPSVIRLGRLIFSFVDNPFFKEASVVDTQLTTKARRDLEDIIELSGQIKKGTEQLSKANNQ